MRGLVPRLALAAIAAGGLATACSIGDDPSPVGVELLPGGILEGGIRVVVVRDFERATDYGIFPAARGDGDRITTAHEWPNVPGYESRALIRFDLAPLDSLPEGTEVVTARIRLSYVPAAEQPIEIGIHRVTSEWSEEAATWQRRLLGEDWAVPGGDFEPEPVAVFEILPAPTDTTQADSVHVDLPNEVVRDWLDGTLPNHGVILVQRTPGERIELVSRGLDGVNPNGPALQMEIQLPGVGVPAALGSIEAREDTFIVLDAAPLAPDPGLLVNAAEPPRRTFLLPDLDGVPEGATVARAQLVMTVAATRLPEDSLAVVALAAQSVFRGEATILPAPSIFSSLGTVTVTMETQPGDSLVFESRQLTATVQRWLRTPTSNLGIGLRTVGEEIVFGGVRFHGLEAPEGLRPRLRIVFLAPRTPGGQ